MEFRNQESALQYMSSRKQEIMEDIDREQKEYTQQYQNVRSIPEVKVLVDEIIRLMRERYYGSADFYRDYIYLRNSNYGYDPTAVKVFYSSFNLNSPQRNFVGFIQYLCEEIYKHTGYDLHIDIASTFSGSYEVVVSKFHLNPSDDDLGTPPSHNCSRSIAKRVPGRKLIAQISNFRKRYCSIDLFNCDSNRNRYDMFRRDCCDIAEFPMGFFRNACFYELTYIRRMSPYHVHEFHAFLHNATPDRSSSKPTGGINW